MGSPIGPLLFALLFTVLLGAMILILIYDKEAREWGPVWMYAGSLGFVGFVMSWFMVFFGPVS